MRQGADIVEIIDALNNSDGLSDGADISRAIIEIEAKQRREEKRRDILEKRDAQAAVSRDKIPSAAHVQQVTSSPRQ